MMSKPEKNAGTFSSLLNLNRSDSHSKTAAPEKWSSKAKPTLKMTKPTATRPAQVATRAGSNTNRVGAGVGAASFMVPSPSHSGLRVASAANDHDMLSREDSRLLAYPAAVPAQHRDCRPPKLFVNAEPGGIVVGRQRAIARSFPNQTEVTVPGIHVIQEDAPDLIGAALSAWRSVLV
jgi:hypothetical protein